MDHVEDAPREREGGDRAEADPESAARRRRRLLDRARSVFRPRHDGGTYHRARFSFGGRGGAPDRVWPRGDERHRLGDDPARHLRRAAYAVGERDRDLFDAAARFQRAVGHLDLERVAGGVGRLDVHRPQDGGPVGAVAGSGVADVVAEREGCVAIAPHRQHQPALGPVGDLAAGDVTRADREVGAALDRREEARQRGRIVREVGVDLDHDVVAAGDPDRVAGAVRAPEAHLVRPAEHFDAAELGAERLGLVGGAVGAAVVDDQDVRVVDRGADAMHQRVDVLDLVERGNGDPDLGHRVTSPLATGRGACARLRRAPACRGALLRAGRSATRRCPSRCRCRRRGSGR